MRDLSNVSSDPAKAEAWAQFIDPTNYADKEEVVARVREHVTSLLPQVRSQRSKLHELWDRYYGVWAAKHKIRLYEGRSDLYFPVARKIIEQHVAGIKMQSFPATDSFWVEPNYDGTGGDPIQAEMLSLYQKSIGSTIKHDVEQSRMARWMDMFIRQALIYGTSIVKSFWHNKTATNYKLKRKKLEDGTGYVNMVEPQEVTLYDGPTFKVVNLLDWFIHPITCTDMEDARMVFEDCLVDYNHLRSMEEADVYHEVKRVLKPAGSESGDTAAPVESEANKSLRLASYGVNVNQIKEAKKHTWQLTEVWCKFALYGDDKPEVACKVVVCEDVILEIRQNPFFLQRAPYRVFKMTDLQDIFYGQGLLESIEHHQYALNAMLNQTLDAVIFQTNHIIVVNTSLLAQTPETLRIAPRAVWKTSANPNEVVSIIRPPDNSQSAFNTANLIAASMQETAAMNPISMGKVPSKEMTKAETDQVSNAASVPQSSIIRNLEEQVLSPLLHDWFALEQQFRSAERTLKISGMPPVQIEPDALTLDWQFRWMVSSQIPPMIAMLQSQEQASKAAGPPQGGMGSMGAPMPVGSTSQGMGPQIGGISPLV